MDIAVTRAGANVWTLVDLLGRPLGRIVKNPGERFLIEPNERGQKAMASAARELHGSLDGALTAIERHTHGTCQLTKDDEGDT